MNYKMIVTWIMWYKQSCLQRIASVIWYDEKQIEYEIDADVNKIFLNLGKSFWLTKNINHNSCLECET